jgi:hypothetical protein
MVFVGDNDDIWFLSFLFSVICCKIEKRSEKDIARQSQKMRWINV